MSNRPNYPGPPPRPYYPYTERFLREEASQLLRATWGPRLVAFLVDFLLVAVPFNLLGNLLWISKTVTISEATTEAARIEQTLGIPVELHNLLWFLVFGLYATLVSRRQGATVGKRWMNLKVVHQDGSPLSTRDLFLRYTIGYGLSGLIVGIGFLLAFVDKERQALHDKIFKTQVVIADPFKI